MSPILIRAVALKEDGMWVARCLEYNFASCAETLEELPNALLRQVIDQIKADIEAGQKPFFGFKPAPQKYWDMFTAALEVSRPLKPRKSLSQRWRELLDHAKVETQLIPVAA